jgi:peptide methionine sulfoxide reductase msrA/msrB
MTLVLINQSLQTRLTQSLSRRLLSSLWVVATLVLLVACVNKKGADGVNGVRDSATLALDSTMNAVPTPSDSKMNAVALAPDSKTNTPASSTPSPSIQAAMSPSPGAARRETTNTIDVAHQEPPKMTQGRQFQKPPDAELQQRLTPLQYAVTQKAATEPPFSNAYFDNHRDGIYVDVVTGEPLFSSRDKFESGTGWPSFTRPIEKNRVLSKSDDTLGMRRTEVLSSAGQSHLGHVFDDGPAPTGLRYCINSAALRFIAVDKLKDEGYGQFLPMFGLSASAPAPSAGTANSCTQPAPGDKAGCSATLETAVLAGGCFWGMQELLRKIPGVLETEVGYAGGTTSNPTYEDVSRGDTGHAEAVRIVFDPQKLSYADLLEKWFFRMHDPTTKNRQHNDVGTQYRSAIFVTNAEQRRVARLAIEHAQASGRWKSPIVTEIDEAGSFTRAEDYHQDYLEKHPNGYTCHYLRE